MVYAKVRVMNAKMVVYVLVFVSVHGWWFFGWGLCMGHVHVELNVREAIGERWDMDPCSDGFC